MKWPGFAVASMLFSFLCGSADVYGFPHVHTLKEVCGNYHNTTVYDVGLPVKTYVESVGGYMEMSIVTFSNDYTFLIDPPTNNLVASQVVAYLRMKDTFRLAYAMGLKVKQICAWNHSSPNSILAVSFEE